jgi:hypothetical protein
MARPLYTAHKTALSTLYSEVDDEAAHLPVVFIGTAGSIIERSNASGMRFYAHQYYDAEGKKKERYVAGPVGKKEADKKAKSLRERVDAARALSSSTRLLAREGYYMADARTYATVASLHNHGFFAAGGTLLGSHAYGALLNHMGVRAAIYKTEDVDIARNQPLQLAAEFQDGILGVLTASGLNLVEAPRINIREPSTTFMLPGASRFKVDLLVPVSKGRKPFMPVIMPELKAYGTSLPYLDYLLAETQTVTLIAREGVCPVRVPVPHRMAWHKILVSALRATQSSKSKKDFEQGCILLAAVGDTDTQAITEAAGDLSKSARDKIATRKDLVETALLMHPRALETFQDAMRSWKLKT